MTGLDLRRVLAVAALATALTTVAGCSGGAGSSAGAPGPSASTSGSAAPGPTTPGGGTAASPDPGGTAGGNATEVCAAVRRAGSESATKFVGELGKMLQASSGNDKTAANTARRNAEAALAGWATAVREQAARATDPRLKAALTDTAAEITKIKPDVTSVNESTLNQLQQRVDGLCGG